MEDCDAYQKYKHHRQWFNKLWVSHKFNHVCGPAGTEIPKDGVYVIRPIYNLGGMGAGASLKELNKMIVDQYLLDIFGVNTLKEHTTL